MVFRCPRCGGDFWQTEVHEQRGPTVRSTLAFLALWAVFCFIGAGLTLLLVLK